MDPLNDFFYNLFLGTPSLSEFDNFTNEQITPDMIRNVAPSYLLSVAGSQGTEKKEDD